MQDNDQVFFSGPFFWDILKQIFTMKPTQASVIHGVLFCKMHVRQTSLFLAGGGSVKTVYQL